MRIRRFLFACALLVVALGLAPAWAETHDDEMEEEMMDAEQKFRIHGEVRTRWEYLENYLDLDDDSDDSAGFFPYRVRIGAHGMFADDVWGYVELQNFGAFGNDFSPSEAFSNDPIGQTDVSVIDISEVHVYQGYLKLKDIGGSKFSLLLGRAEHTFGNELMLGDADFYAGQAFDGLRGMWDGENMDLNVFHYMIGELDNFALIDDDAADDSDISLSGATLKFGLGDEEGGQTIEPYVLFYRDGFYEDFGGKLYTVGAQYGRRVMNGDDMDDNAWDWNAEVALQGGDFEPNGADLSFGGNIIEGWLGYNWGDDDSHHRAHIGLLRASGDDDPLDDDLDGFIALFPDEHAHNRLGDLDLFGGSSNAIGSALSPDFSILGTPISNVTDLNLGWEWWGGKHSFMAALHNLSVTEEDVVDGDDGIGNEVDVRYGYEYNDSLAFEAGIANLFTDDDLGEDADDIMRAWWQFKLDW